MLFTFMQGLQACMCVGRGEYGGQGPLLDFEIWHFPIKFLGKRLFSWFRVVKMNFYHFWPPCKNPFGYLWEIHHWPFPEKNPSDAHWSVLNPCSLSRSTCWGWSPVALSHYFESPAAKLTSSCFKTRELVPTMFLRCSFEAYFIREKTNINHVATYIFEKAHHIFTRLNCAVQIFTEYCTCTREA